MSHDEHKHDPHATHGSVDDWHHHSASEGLPQEEHGGIANPLILGKALGLIILSTLALMGVTMLYFNYGFGKLHRERTDADLSGDVTAYRSAAEKRLAEYGWINVATSEVQIPESVARQRVIERYRKGSR
jgi:hypothetical protein